MIFSRIEKWIKSYSTAALFMMVLPMAVILLALQTRFSLGYLFLPVFGVFAGYSINYGIKKILQVSLVSFLAYFITLGIYYDKLSFLETFFGSFISSTGVVLMCVAVTMIHRRIKHQNPALSELNILNRTIIWSSVVAPIIPSIIGPMYFAYLNPGYSVNVVYITLFRLWIGGAIGIVVFAPLTYFIFSGRLNGKLDSTHMISTVISALVASVTTFLIVHNNKLSVDKTLAQKVSQIEINLQKNLERSIVSLSVFKTSYTVDAANFKLLVSSSKAREEHFNLNDLSFKFIDSLAVYDVIGSKGGEVLSLVDRVDFHPAKYELVKKWKVKNDIYKDPIQVKNLTMLTIDDLTDNTSIINIGFPVSTVRSDGKVGTRMLFMMLNLERLTAINPLIIEAREKGLKSIISYKLLNSPYWTLLNDTQYFGLSDVKTKMPFQDTRFISNYALKLKLFAFAPPVAYFVFTNIGHWIILVTFLIAISLLTYILLSSLDAKIRLISTNEELTSEIQGRSDAEKELKKLNSNLERQVDVKSREMNKNLYEKNLIFKVFPDLMIKASVSGDIIDMQVGDESGDLFPSAVISLIRNNSSELDSQREDLLLKFRNAVNSGELQLFQATAFSPGGKKLYIEARIIKFNNNSVVCFFRNITDKVEMELNLEEKTLLAVHSSKLASLGEMAGSIAHEINNPLAIIGGSAELLKQYVSSGLLTADKAEKISQRILGTVDRVAKIIKGLKTFSHSEYHDFEFVNAEQFIDDFLCFSKERFKAANISLEIRNKLKSDTIFANSVGLVQVMVNLLNNAYDAVLECDDRWVVVTLSETQNLFKIDITDSGKGIPKEIRNKITEPFFTTKKLGEGTGLGLSISQSLIVKQKGSLVLESKSQHTCFSITLPKHDEISPDLIH